MEYNRMKCESCPRNCNVDRQVNKGYCGVRNLPVAAKAFLHKWEEPCISGKNGSGTVFLSGCNLNCVFCQNFPISHERVGKEISEGELVGVFLRLQEKGAHNINIVNPSHYTVQLKRCITAARAKGLSIPMVYNSNGYDSVEGLKMLEGLIDVYLPDFKYYHNETAAKYSNAQNYFETVTAAIPEMYRQVGGPVFDDEGIIKKGLIIRHLVMPGLASESIKILDWIKENMPEDIYISIMSQYVPYYKAADYPEINRRITRREYERVLNHLDKLGIENGYMQERESACDEYVPSFDLEGIE